MEKNKKKHFNRRVNHRHEVTPEALESLLQEMLGF
jgi:hypothetical protein